MSSTPKGQLTLDEFVPRVRVDSDGDPIPPEEVAGYHQSVEETTEFATWAAPTRTETGYLNGTPTERQRRVYVVVDSELKSDTIGVYLEEALRKPFSPETCIDKADDPVAAVEAAIDWMEANPAPEDPECPNERVEPEQVMYYRKRGKQSEAIREGSKVTIDGYSAEIVGKRDRDVDSDQDATTPQVGGRKSPTTFIAETPSGDQFDIVVDQSKTRYTTGYTKPGTTVDEADTLIGPQHVDVSNEDNLRDDVHRETYQWLKDHQGELVIHDGDGETIEVVEINSVRDGALNPSGGAVDPDGRRTTYIDTSHAGEWFPCPFDLEPGAYRVVAEGLVSGDDKYGATIHVPIDEWTSYDLPTPDDKPSRTDVDLDISLPADRSGLSANDHVTNIIGVGDKTAEKLWKRTVGELYDHGWPLPFISSQYHARAVADLFSLAESYKGEIERTDAVRAVVGMFGGVAFDQDGEYLGCTANTITGELPIQESASGWLSPRHGIKRDYCPNWSVKGSDGSDGINTIAVGGFADGDITRAIINSNGTASNLESEDIEQFAVEQIWEPVGAHEGTVALTGQDDSYVEVAKRPVEIAGTLALCDISDPEQLARTVTYWPAGDGKGVVLFDNPEVEWSVVIDTENYVNPRTTVQSEE